MSIKEFFSGKYIFITGGSGFIGKVLIEKLLRSCDGIEKIYVLLREKRQQTVKDRLQSIIDSPLFDKLKEINPEAVKKLVPISGDVMELNLGLTEKDEKIIIENVDIIYHVAASVRFDDHLKYSILLNTRGTREAVNLALKAKKLVTFMHISTAYCNCDKKYIEEKIYPAHVDWKKAITLAEEADQRTLEVLTKKFIDPLPNTYTFTKSLAEHTVNDMCRGNLLAGIVRPSIVLFTQEDPFPGFIDNFNGPIALLTAGGKGLLRTVYIDENVAMNYIPVDTVIKFIILATYERAIIRSLNEVPVYNASNVGKSGIKHKDMIGLGLKTTWIVPYEKLFWYPSVCMTNNLFRYFINFLFCQLFPAMFFDGMLKLLGKKQMFTRLQRKIYIGNMSIEYFMRNGWTFVNDNSLALNKYITNSERDEFSFENSFSLQSKEVFFSLYLKAKIAGEKFLFNEKYDKKKGFRNTMIFWILDCILKSILYGGLCWILTTKFNVFTILQDLITRFNLYLNNL